MMWTSLKCMALVVLVMVTGLLGAGDGLWPLPALADEPSSVAATTKPVAPAAVRAPQVPAPAFAHGNKVNLLAFSPDGKLLASGGGGGIAEIRIWSLGNSKMIAEFDVHRAGITGLAFSPDGTKLVSGAWDSQVIAWDVASAKEIRRFEHDAGVTDLCISPNGKLLATGSLGGTVRLFELDSGKEVRRMSLEEQRDDAVVSVSFSADGTEVGAISNRGAPAGLWDVATGKQVSYRVEPRWRLARQGLRLRQFQGTGGFEHISPDGHTVVEPGSLAPIEAVTGQPRFRAPFFATPAAVAPDGRQIAWTTGSDGAVRVCSLATLAGVTNPPERLEANELEACWADLGADAARAYRAGWLLSAVPEQAVALMREKMRVRPEIERLVADLDSANFLVRQKATAELEKRGDAALAGLRKVLVRSPSLEFTARAERIIAGLEPEVVRSMRVAEVLNRMGTPEARQVLEQMAGPDAKAASAETRRVEQK